MKLYRVFLGLGSNIGDRQAYLARAAKGLRSLPRSSCTSVSSVYETEPYGEANQPPFLNAVMEIETGLEPPELFVYLKQMEQDLGRSHTERWGPREIDLDLLLYDGVVYSDAGLTVPHADLDRRKFVLVPFAEIADDVVHPISGLTIGELRSSCTDSSRVVKSLHRIIL
jgi:dihydroneopterin aldolase / 2-amino-4-hydroxy-6-hydroxymethyldihydropteridine diphosphokinase